MFLEGLVPVTESLAVAAVAGPAGNSVAAENENEIVASAELETKTGHETELKTKTKRPTGPKTRTNKGNTFFLSHLNFQALSLFFL